MRMVPDPDTTPQNHAHEKMLRWLRDVRFRKTMFGGVDERDLWKKLGELNDLYEEALSAERARYDALLDESRKESRKYKDAWLQTREKYGTLLKHLQKQTKTGQEKGDGRKTQ